MTPDPVDIVAREVRALRHAEQGGSCVATDEDRAIATEMLRSLRAAGLEVVRFGTDYKEPKVPLWARHCLTGAVIIERWPGDDSHLRRPA